MIPRLSKGFLHECFAYKDGRLVWRERPPHHFCSEGRAKHWNKQHAGKPAGWLHIASGRWHVSIGDFYYKASILIWVYHKGVWPEKDVDHKDADCGNDKIENLREATRSQNMGNARKQKNNTSGHKGVIWHKAAKSWVAQIQCGGKQRYIGCFRSKEEAAAAYAEKSKELFGEFSRT